MKETSILVSACLVGIKCNYKGEDNFEKAVMDLTKNFLLIPFCPEQLGGLTTPRIPQVIVQGSGDDVLKGKSKVITRKDIDVTENFLKGAMESLLIAQMNNCKIAILKERSPSCGVSKIYNKKTKNEELVLGRGVTSALLVQNNITIISEEDIRENPYLLESIVE